MPDAILRQVNTVLLELTLEEAKWLKVVVQNPLGDGESVGDYAMREQFFKALPEFERLEKANA